jgi:hypothetical protein
MKKLVILFSVVAVAFTACENDNAPNPEVTTSSKVVTVSYPTITLNGNEFVHIPVGGTFVDSGATLIDDVTGAVSQITATSSELDNTTPGLYAVLYEAKNANGFLTTATRTVLVLDYTPPATLDPNFNIEGYYLRAATGVLCHIVRMDNGLYINDHIGGSTPVPGYFVMPDTVSFDIPPQVTSGLQLSGNSEVFNPGPPITLQYKLAASGFGTGNRIFVKQ